MARHRPAVFIGSSSEGHDIAQAIQVLLDKKCEVEIWSQGVFGLTRGNLESLVLALNRFDFAVLVLTADDLTLSRDISKAVPRDNVVFELGLFVGGLGRDRTFIVYDRTNPPELPSDLAGVAAATYELHSSGNLQASLGAAVTQIEREIERLGLHPQERLQRITDAAASVEDVGLRIDDLIKLLARSRKVELEVIAAQFGMLIDPEKLEQIKKDLRDLEESLGRNDV